MPFVRRRTRSWGSRPCAGPASWSMRCTPTSGSSHPAFRACCHRPAIIPADRTPITAGRRRAALKRPPRLARPWRPDVFVLVVGGGKVGYYLAKGLIDSGHEVALMEKDSTRARQITDEIGSIVIPHDGCEGKYLAEAGCNRADVVAAVTGDDEDNLVICQMAKHHFDVPRTIARVNNPKNEVLFRPLGVDELVSPTRMILGSIEQDIPVHELLHLAALGEGELEIIEAHLQAGSPAIGRSPDQLDMPEGCSLLAVVRGGIATPP